MSFVRVMRSGFVAFVGLLLFLGYLPAQAQTTAVTANIEMRGVWLTNVDSDVLFTQQNLTNALERLTRLNFNTVYPTVWNGGYTLYPSAAAERVIGRAVHPEPGLQGRDMLAETVAQGHARGLRVIPWFESGFMVPLESELVRRHPNWFTERRDGTRIVMEGKHQRLWLNPLQPEVQQLLIDTISETVAKYNIDGIQLDDHFGLPFDLGYDNYTTQLYWKENQGKYPPNNPRDPKWMRWRANKLTDLVIRIFNAVKARKQDLGISIAPNPYPIAYRDSLQDWRNWERRGLVNELVLQVYRGDIKTFVTELERPEVIDARSHIPVGIGILQGLKNNPISVDVVQKQVWAVRQRGFSGMSFFFYESLAGRDEAIQAFFPPIIKQFVEAAR
ncbi:MAG: glycoside hydrolase family 10 protein [Gloeobacterales cyanobacterium]